ncbi:uncharacterized protein [Triticum aestivum]|uniref:uncharacterized protein n=2 Tax=Triticinae TaxID=1648030 RepID=UPI001D00BD2D|nr:uncharacterized protein LOC123124979 [Triticum aestivum]
MLPHRSPRYILRSHHPLPRSSTSRRRRTGPLLRRLDQASRLVSVPSACMDRRPEGSRARKRAREEPDQAADFPFDEAAAAADAGEAWRRPPGVFQFPWQKCRGGLGVAGGGGWELRDVFFHSLVDGGAAAIGVPGDRLVSPPPPSKQRALFDDVDAWLAAAADGEVDPVWRSAIRGAGPSASAV